MDEEQAAIVKERDDIISKVYYGPDGGRTAYKTYLDAREIDPEITFGLGKGMVQEEYRKNETSRWSKKQLCSTTSLS